MNSLLLEGIDRLGEGPGHRHSPEGLVEAVGWRRWPGRCPVAPRLLTDRREARALRRISSLARALTLASHTGRARGPRPATPLDVASVRCRRGSTDVAWSEGERADSSSTRPSGPPHVVAVGPELRSRVMSDVVTYEFEGDVASPHRRREGQRPVAGVVAALDEAVALPRPRPSPHADRSGRWFSAGFDLPMQASVESAQSWWRRVPAWPCVSTGWASRPSPPARVTPSPWGRCSSWPVTPAGRGASSASASTKWPSDWAYRCSASSWPETLDPRRFTEATVQAQLYDPDGAAEIGADRVVMAGALEADARAVSTAWPSCAVARTCTPRCDPPGHDRSRAGDLDADVAAVVAIGRPT